MKDIKLKRKRPLLVCYRFLLHVRTYKLLIETKVGIQFSQQKIHEFVNLNQLFTFMMHRNQVLTFYITILAIDILHSSISVLLYLFI